MIHLISLGGGIQSTTLALMSILGEIDPPALCAVFADTQWERRVRRVSGENIEWLTRISHSPWKRGKYPRGNAVRRRVAL